MNETADWWAVWTSTEGIYDFTASPTQAEALQKFNQAALRRQVLSDPRGAFDFVRVPCHSGSTE